MEKVLHILDISPHIYAGNVNKRAVIRDELRNTPNGWVENSIPSGGIAYLFNKIYDFGYKDKMVFVADRCATIKKAMYPDYKGDRTPKPEVDNQCEIAELILKQCGFDLLYEEGYEADDIIWSLVQKYKSEYDKVYVHTGDSDMYVLVDDNVEVVPASSKGKHVTRANYEVTVLKNEIVPYNSLTFAKVLYGETGDNIPPLPKHLSAKLRQAFYSPFYYGKMGDKQFMRSIIESLFPEALANFDLVYPLDVSVSIDRYSSPDLSLTRVWGRLVGNNRFQQVKAIPVSVKQMKNQLFAEGSHYLD